METDADVIAGRVAMRGADADVPLSEQVLFARFHASALFPILLFAGSHVVGETLELCAYELESEL